MIRRPPRSTQGRSSAASDVYKRQVVFRLNGYTPVRISTQWVEEKLAGIDLSEARAFTMQIEGHAFYWLNVPGVDTSLVYDVLSGCLLYTSPSPRDS